MSKSLVDMVNEMPEDLTQKDNGSTDELTTEPTEPTEPTDSNDSGGSDPKKSNGGGADDRGDVDDKSAKGGSGGTKEGSKKGTDGEGGTTEDKDAEDSYVADEDDPTDVEEPKSEPSEPSEPTDLSPELQYVVANLPTLTVRGKTATGSKTYQVKAAGQLPEDFEFVTKREELLFNQALAGQELRARELQSQYIQEQNAKSATEFSEKENRDIRKDIGDLQREGRLVRFKVQPDNPKFSEDPGVKEAQDVIDYMNKRNSEYLESANKGGVLYHLSFKDAFEQMQRQKPTNDAQTNEDKERKQVARQTSGAVTGGGNAPQKPRIARSMDDLINRFETLEF